MKFEDMHLLTGAYALDALVPDEAAAFERHMEACSDCAAEVRELQATAIRLGDASSQAVPASMRAKVLNEVAATRQLPPMPRSSDAGASKATDHRRVSTRIFALAAGVMAVLMMGAGIVALQQHQRASDSEQQTKLIASVLTAPDARTVSSNVEGAGHAAVVMSPSQGKAVFVATGLAAPPAGSVYELWRIDASGSPARAGTYLPDANGAATVVLEGDMAGTETVAVTVEKDGGVDQPSGDPVAAFSVTA